jgi:hypothetical protein
MWATIMLLVVALMAPPKQQFRSWVSSPNYDTKGHCGYTIFVSGNVPYRWTIDKPVPSRMVDEPITGIDSFQVIVPYNQWGDLEIRVFLKKNATYDKPDWSWQHRIPCEGRKTKGWTQES